MRTSTWVAVLSLVLAACGGGGDAGADAADEPEAVATATAAATGPSEGGPEATEDRKAEASISLPATDAADAPGADATEPPATAPTAEEPTGPPTEGLPGGRYVQIEGITAEGQGYAVAFQAINFTPVIGTGPDEHHVHFFFDDVEPQNAGTNGPAPGAWFLYDGPSPFTGYGFADRPPAATQLCALVADSAHGVTVGSGNCVTLP